MIVVCPCRPLQTLSSSLINQATQKMLQIGLFVAANSISHSKQVPKI
ncbi:unnamed protein product [Soboliphyme baturini]|uniref:Uncharacterized protein n=1 Tax=Soboliphyme baturini TaxID=241478 RepID=A0A183J132_9BILA|nr:unnamed protein product [Soboliphyme baturini]